MSSAASRIALGLFVAFAAVASLWLRGDDAPPDDADLMAVPAPLPDAANGFVALSAAAELVRWPDDVGQSARWEALARGIAWDDALAAQTQAVNATALDGLARAARLPAFQSPPIRDLAHDVPDFRAWTRLVQLAAIRSLALARSGDAASALDAALAPIRIGRAVSVNPNGALLSGVAGLELADAGVGALNASLAQLSAAPDVARAATEQLAALHVPADGWRAMWASEYRTTRALRIAADPAEILASRPAWAWLARVLPASYLYEPNKTLAAHAARIRARQAAAGAVCTPDDASELPPAAQVSDLSLLLPNGAGRLAARESLARFDVRRCLSDTRLELARGALALLAYERANGVLPVDLQMLVPAWLPSLPRDGFAEGALRFDPKQRVLYSVGSDGVDERGREHRGVPGDGSDALEPRLVLPRLASAPTSAGA